MVSIDPACGTSSAFSCAGSKSTTVTSRWSSGSHLLRAPDHHRPTKVALGNIVQASVERTFAWLGRCRRLAKDWENLNRKALAFLRLASIRLMLRKLRNPSKCFRTDPDVEPNPTLMKLY